MLRRRGKGPKDPIADFWAWWSGARPRVERALATNDFGGLADEFSSHVQAIDPGLEWELGRGQVAEHVLCVTAAGKGELRGVAERWRIAGPEPDAVWEYAAARPADPQVLGLTMTLDETELALAECRIGVTVDDDRQQIDVVVHHPCFPSMTDDAKATVSFLILDWSLGEDGVGRWVGEVGWSDDEPPGSLPPDALGEIIGGIQERHPEPTWAILQADGLDGRPMLVVARRPLKRVEHPLFDLHGAIELPFAEQTPAGLPERPALDRLRAFEDHLESVAGDDVLLAAHETHAGTRTIHLYCDSQGAGRARVDGFVGQRHWPAARLSWHLDPGWDAIRPFL